LSLTDTLLEIKPLPQAVPSTEVTLIGAFIFVQGIPSFTTRVRSSGSKALSSSKRSFQLDKFTPIWSPLIVFSLFYNGSFVTAQSHQQKSVSLSATQAEYQALSSAVQDILFFRTILKEMGFSEEMPTPLMCDNQGALYLAISTKNHPKIKHIAIRYHFIRDAIHTEQVQLLYVPTQNQIADIFTNFNFCE
jgi:hypothetical protein